MRFRGQKAGLHTICGSKICLEVIRGRIQGQKEGLRTSYGSKMGMEVIKEISRSERGTTHFLWIENGHEISSSESRTTHHL